MQQGEYEADSWLGLNDLKPFLGFERRDIKRNLNDFPPKTKKHGCSSSPSTKSAAIKYLERIV